MTSELLVNELKRHEGFSKDLYRDTTGHQTIGYGFNVEAPISEGLADAILRYQIKEKHEELLKVFDWYANLGTARRDVVLNMVFNLGLDGFKKFKNTIYLISTGRHEEASVEMLKSKWAEQVGNRAKYLAEKYRRG